MARTFTPLTGTGAGSAIILNDKFGFQSAEKIRQALDIAAYLGGHFDLGGDERGILSASYVPVNGSRRFSLDGSQVGGLTLEVVLSYYTSNAATSVRLRVRNLTDSTNAVEGTLSTATTRTEETLTVTLASGIKSYELQITGGNATNGIFGWGYLRLRKIPA